MGKSSSKSIALRSLLTETLPYEVPVIFSNDKFHAGMAAPWSDAINVAMKKLTSYKDRFTVPYCYKIAKDQNRTTTLGIIHPLVQLSIAEFYDLHSGSILNYCSNEKFSLRRPIALASPFSSKVDDDDSSRLRIGVVQELVEAGEPDVSHLTSYFTYGKYNLLGKFVSSREFIRLEAKYLLYRSIDISKCFYNIYTHSITWSVKDKAFAKQNRDSYSFESRFDQLMQRSNYNETNGIIVGPEFSRLFAEIILQDADASVELDMRNKDLIAGRDYDVRRYVDDYFVFANDIATLDTIERAVRTHLERYKLFANEKKIATFSRPFVSQLSLARSEIGATLRSVRAILTEIRGSPDKISSQKVGKQLNAQFRDIRFIVAKYQIDFANISGWILSRLKGVLRQCLRLMDVPELHTHKEALGDIAIGILEVAFYVCALDVRVRTTYSICQLSLILREARTKFTLEQLDLIQHITMDETASILRSLKARQGSNFGITDSIETYNLLICGAEFVGPDFVNSRSIQDILNLYLKSAKIPYFAFITLKFCYLKNKDLFQNELRDLNAKAYSRITASEVLVERDTEEYLFLCDYLGSIDIPASEKRAIFNALFGGDISKAAIAEMSKYVGFVDWTGLSVEHLLKRKELRPVYAWG